MTVGKIALGVFLGNLAFGLIAWMVIYAAMDIGRQNALVAETNARYEQMKADHPEMANQYDAELRNAQ